MPPRSNAGRRSSGMRWSVRMDRQAPEYLLNLLAQGASLCATDRGQAFVLFQRACALLWRLDPTPPIKLERRLRTPLAATLAQVGQFCIGTNTVNRLARGLLNTALMRGFLLLTRTSRICPARALSSLRCMSVRLHTLRSWQASAAFRVKPIIVL